LRAGDRVQLTDPKGRKNTIELTPGATFHTYRGTFDHDSLIGRPEGTGVVTTGAVPYLALRPLLADYVLSMPRGAAVVYPKDAAQIVTMADVYPGARVIEAGAGSGGLTLSLLRAVGESGSVLSVERRPEFAEVARANVEAFFDGPHPAWRLVVGEVSDVIVRESQADESRPMADRVILDMLAPWENIGAVALALEPGGVLAAYVATVTQLSRLAEAVRDSGDFTEPDAWETMVRDWHLEGLAVRPEHRMIGHTGFLLTARRMAPGVRAPERRRRPAPGAYGPRGEDGQREPIYGDQEWDGVELGEREPSAKKLRRLRRDAARRAEGEGNGLDAV
jgi:tRNA (adenine57-N1/adenine58-N1)-methyltransferase